MNQKIRTYTHTDIHDHALNANKLNTKASVGCIRIVCNLQRGSGCLSLAFSLLLLITMKYAKVTRQHMSQRQLTEMTE
jgi:hypothetical protein